MLSQTLLYLWPVRLGLVWLAYREYPRAVRILVAYIFAAQVEFLLWEVDHLLRIKYVAVGDEQVEKRVLFYVTISVHTNNCKP